MVKTTKLSGAVLKQVNAFAKQLKAIDIPVEQLIVFGSQAKGNTHKWSDIDVCVVSNSFGSDHFNTMVRLSQLTNSQTPDIEPHPMHPRDLQNKYDSLAAEISKHGIRVV